MKNIVVCGDSFSIGIGCPNIKKEPYGSLLAKELDANLLNFAKGSSSNFSILLQVKYAIENVKDIDFLCVGMTCNYRTEWFKDDYDFDNEIKNTDVNYHEYPPYGKDTNNVLLDKHPMQDDPNYKGGMFTENYMGIVNYYESVIKKKEKFGNYFSKFDSESPEKMKILYDYYFNFFNIKI
jgi:hypothetical protein